jgi:hypothetical protein
MAKNLGIEWYFTNQAIDIDTLSRRVFAHGKASKRRCSTPYSKF